MNTCVICTAEFERPKKSRRQTCSGSCHAALGWRDPGKREARIASITKVRRTPESRACSTASNNRRWAQPGARENLSERNRQRWSDPTAKAAWANAIAAAWNGERRERLSMVKAAQWQDPVIRGRMLASHHAPEYRQKMSDAMRRRWADPVMRDRMIRKLLARVRSPEFREAASAWMKARWSKADYRAAGLASPAAGRKDQPEGFRRFRALQRALKALERPKARRLAIVPIGPTAPEIAKRQAVQPSAKARRVCLTCERPFQSKHIGNRMCDACRMAA